MERQIKGFEELCIMFEEKFKPTSDYESFENTIERMEKANQSEMNLFDSIVNEVVKNDQQLRQLVEGYNKMTDTLEYLIEKKSVFDKASQLITFQSKWLFNQYSQFFRRRIWLERKLLSRRH